MLRHNTPVEHYPELGLFVKREDLACPPPGPPFSKTRGVFRHVETKIKEGFKTFGVLDTFHSQAGHAVARACQLLGAKCVNFYPEYKHQPGFRPPQERARELGAELEGIPAGMSAVLFHLAKRRLRESRGEDSYMMPNALKLRESVEETAKEVGEDCLDADNVLIPVSSATIAAGVIRGFLLADKQPRFLLHMGYSRSQDKLLEYLRDMVGEDLPLFIQLVDEGYSYKQAARSSQFGVPPFPCSPYYDLKALRWWQRAGRSVNEGKTLLWNVG